MSRVNIYLPDDLAAEARTAGLNISGITQEALRRQLAGRRASAWLQRVRDQSRSTVTHREVIEVLDAARAEFGDEWPAPTGGPGSPTEAV
jgi:post-segregation antitoxin (ccd killing protein)